MKPLDPPTSVSFILSFDFDGTLHDPAATPPVPLRLFEVLERLRRERGAVWGINTGRSVPQMLEGFLESGFPFLPDWVVAREREIYFPNSFGRWIAHEDWNRRCEKEMAKLFKRCRKLFKAIHHEISEHTGAQWIEMHGEPAGIISRTEEEMEWIAARVTAMAEDMPELGWQRNSIYLRFGHRNYQKGSSLAEVARKHGIGAAACFAIGDSHNDLEMLHPGVAGMIACPANAVGEVKNQVTTHGGYVTRAAHGEGAVEALMRFFA
jgi:HAD superfamily hydrolase (TIGR01484 family)